MDTPLGSQTEHTERASNDETISSRWKPKNEKNKKSKNWKSKNKHFQAITLNVSVARRQEIETNEEKKGNRRRARIEL